jgi:hypothetical protein
MMLACREGAAGGVLFQVLFGFNFSVAVWVGFIACFGSDADRRSDARLFARGGRAARWAGGHFFPGALKRIIMEGAVHRLRPKLLTEGTIIIGLARMLWATGQGLRSCDRWRAGARRHPGGRRSDRPVDPRVVLPCPRGWRSCTRGELRDRGARWRRHCGRRTT